MKVQAYGCHKTKEIQKIILPQMTEIIPFANPLAGVPTRKVMVGKRPLERTWPALGAAMTS